MRILIFVFIPFFGCNFDKQYTVTISSMDPKTKMTIETKTIIKAKDDTSAFKSACGHYWATKAAVLKVNKNLEGTPGFLISPIPFFFSVESKQGIAINFSTEEAERLTFATVNYYKEKVITFIDTITPIIKKPKTEPAKIY